MAHLDHDRCRDAGRAEHARRNPGNRRRRPHLTVHERPPTTRTGFTKYGQRWYNPTQGRFTQQDNLSFIGNPRNGNRHAYAGCNPVTNIDPTGKDWISTIGEGLGVGLACASGFTVGLSIAPFVAPWLPGAAILLPIAGCIASYLSSTLTGIDFLSPDPSGPRPAERHGSLSRQEPSVVDRSNQPSFWYQVTLAVVCAGDGALLFNLGYRTHAVVALVGATIWLGMAVRRFTPDSERQVGT
ncbi:RHS repeat-associated core domain-containing protein [Micromonospora sp. NPDC002389]|uniref:RHS repeat-associated core domain-containing protein n=1 Tax=Micromonospora sp. NPDC002389 TaxID=3154272 RepID=UPI00332A652F